MFYGGFSGCWECVDKLEVSLRVKNVNALISLKRAFRVLGPKQGVLVGKGGFRGCFGALIWLFEKKNEENA